MKRRYSYFLTTFILVIVTILLHRAGYLDTAESFGKSLISPVGIYLNDLGRGVRNFFGTIRSISSLEKKNRELEKKVKELQIEISDLREAKQENELLKKQLDFNQSSGYKTAPATVSFYDPSNFSGYILIDKGRDDGIKEGMSVLSEGFLVGYVKEALSKNSKVVLLVDPNFSTPVLVENSDASGLLKGQLGFGLVLEKVPQNIPLKVGDTVVTSGLGGLFPKGLVIGQVEEISKQSNTIFQSATIKSAVDLKRLNKVFIILPENN